MRIHNPHTRPIDDLPIIYGFNNGGRQGFGYHAVAIAQDGTYLGSHFCSDESYMMTDLGLVEGSRPDRKIVYDEHYPGGYRCLFVPGHAILECEGLLQAFKFNQMQESD
jgi:hypothetical protein